MADYALSNRLLARADLGAADWLREHAGLISVVGLMIIAAIARLWALDDQALHHDESLHAQFAYNLYRGTGYEHDPLLHGPFLFHVGAASYFLFGDSEFTARLAPALFGVVLVGMPLLLRRQIGWPAVIIAATLLAFSPTLLYFSRFLRNDIYIAVWSLGMVICVWRYLEDQRPAYLVALAALMALSFATKEVTFIFVAILLVFLNLLLTLELARPPEQGDQSGSQNSWLRGAVVFPVAWLLAALWPLMGHRPFGRGDLPAVGAVLLVVGTLTLPQFAAGIQALPFIGDDGVNAASETTMRAVIPAVLIVATAFFGLIWRPWLWLLVAAAFYIPFFLLFTTFFTNIDGFLSGIWGSLDYWIGQQDVRRGNQPGYYYALVTPLYEFLPLLLAGAGAAWLALSRKALNGWMLFWLVAMFIGLSLAGEKMPWLEVHIALPLAMAGALVLGRLVDGLGFEPERVPPLIAQALLSVAFVLLLVEGGSDLTTVAGLVIAAVSLVWTLASIRVGLDAVARSFLIVVVAALFTLTVRTGVIASFQNDDTPVEVLVYTQSSPEIPAIRDRIDALAEASGLGYNLPIVVDDTDGYAWPWAWYLRRYQSVAFVNDVAAHEGKENAVLLVHAHNASGLNAVGFRQTSYRHRWWFNETYRDLGVGEVADIATSPTSLNGLADFFLHRRPAEGTTGSTDGVAFFPVGYAAFDAGQTPLPPRVPTVLADGRILFGRSGAGAGEILQAADVFVDTGGNIWAADSLAGRIHKFNSDGVYLDSLGAGGSQPGQLNQPWSVVVDDQGFIYVADTWNHRVQKFSPDFKLILTWGVPGSDLTSIAPELYGPRDLVIAPDGTIWLTDTGNKRLMGFSPDGQLIASYGEGGSELGQFSEPVGLAVDASGALYVADAWNGRVQRIDPQGGSPVAIETGWSSTEAGDKPYVTVLADGRILVSSPELASLILFSNDGEELGRWSPSQESRPLGVAALSAGGFVFSDGVRNEIQIVPLSAIDALFGQ